MARAITLSETEALALSESAALGLSESGGSISAPASSTSSLTGVDLTVAGGATVLSGTSTSLMFVQASIDAVGLTGTGGNFEIRVRVGSRVIQPSPQIVVAGTDANAKFLSAPFILPANTAYDVRLKSPNADTAVSTASMLLEIDTDQPGSLMTLLGCPCRGGSANPEPPGGYFSVPGSSGALGGSIGASGDAAGTPCDCPALWGFDMATELIHNDNGTANLSSFAEVFSHTPSASAASAVMFEVNLGSTSSGTGDLDGTGGNYTFRVEIGGRIVQPSPITVAFEATLTEALVPLGPYIVPANTVVKVYAKSPRSETSVAYSVDCFEIDTSTLLPASIADAVWDELQSGHTTAGTFGKYLDDEITSRAAPSDVLAQIQSYDPPTNAEMVAAFTEIKGATWSASTDTLEKIRDAIGGSGASAGASSYTYTVEDANGTPIPGVRVWVTTDQSDSSEAEQGPLISDAQGEVTFYLQPGTYYVWRFAQGRTFTNPSNPDTIEVE